MAEIQGCHVLRNDRGQLCIGVQQSSLMRRKHLLLWTSKWGCNIECRTAYLPEHSLAGWLVVSGAALARSPVFPASCEGSVCPLALHTPCHHMHCPNIISHVSFHVRQQVSNQSSAVQSMPL